MFGVHNKKSVKCLLKCLPMLVLLFSTVAVFASLETMDTEYSTELRKYRMMKLLLAITFSCIGDGCLVFPQIFVLGVASFAVSVLLYINVLEVVDSVTYISLGGILSGICIFFLAVLLVVTIKITSMRSRHFPRVPKTVMVLILVYYFILSVLLWSGITLFLRQRSLVSASAAIGVTMFYISDLLIAASAFWNLTLLRGRGLIMLTYYTAQLLLTLSIIF